MQRSLQNNVSRLTVLVTLFLVALPACAHPDASHGVSGFAAGFLHPLTGLDHLLAMLAVGIWAAQSQGKARWTPVFAFPAMMILGVVIGALGVQLAGVELMIGLSVAALGLLVVFAAKLPPALSTSLIAFFAVFHGFAHGAEMPNGVSIWAYGVGFIVATAMLQLIGMGFGLLRKTKFAFIARSFSGVGIAMAGLFFLFGMA